MKTMKDLLSAIVALLLVASLGACASSRSEQATTTNEPSKPGTSAYDQLVIDQAVEDTYRVPEPFRRNGCLGTYDADIKTRETLGQSDYLRTRRGTVDGCGRVRVGQEAVGP